MQLPPDLTALLSAFTTADVRYLIIGGHAVGVYARPRSTKDLDMWLDPLPDNVARTCETLTRFGVPSTIVEDLRSARPDEIVWMGRVPARVDFLFTIPGVTFPDAWTRRLMIVLEGTNINIIGRDDLLANKRAVGRPQDRRDVRAIENAMSRGKK